ncbi:MAG TPA: hypothetical protein VKG92_08300 [Flavobacteriales bacterium]|nr:hypothetical protein [Flavobacteriales bacterium]
MGFGDIISVILTSIVKFMFSGLVSYSVGNNFLETVLLTALGGCLGTVVFYSTGKRVLEWLRVRYVRRVARRIKQGLPHRRIFTRTNRWIVRMKKNYGVRGFAAFALPLLSIPIAALLAAKYFRHDRRTLPTMLSAVMIWSVVLSVAWSFIK